MEGKEITESDYETYGDAWKKEMTKLPKAIIIDLASKIGKDKATLQSELEKAMELFEYLLNKNGLVSESDADKVYAFLNEGKK